MTGMMKVGRAVVLLGVAVATAGFTAQAPMGDTYLRCTTTWVMETTRPDGRTNPPARGSRPSENTIHVREGTLRFLHNWGEWSSNYVSRCPNILQIRDSFIGVSLADRGRTCSGPNDQLGVLSDADYTINRLNGRLEGTKVRSTSTGGETVTTYTGQCERIDDPATTRVF